MSPYSLKNFRPNYCAVAKKKSQVELYFHLFLFFFKLQKLQSSGSKLPPTEITHISVLFFSLTVLPSDGITSVYLTFDLMAPSLLSTLYLFLTSYSMLLLNWQSNCLSKKSFFVCFFSNLITAKNFSYWFQYFFFPYLGSSGHCNRQHSNSTGKRN